MLVRSFFPAIVAVFFRSAIAEVVHTGHYKAPVGPSTGQGEEATVSMQRHPAMPNDKSEILARLFVTVEGLHVTVPVVRLRRLL